MRRSEGPAAAAVSLGLSLSLAVLLLVMVLNAGADRPAAPPATPPSAPPAKAVSEVDLAAVVLPPPPVAAPAGTVEPTEMAPAPPPVAPPQPEPASAAPAPRLEPPARQPPAKRNSAAPPAAAAPVAITAQSIREGRALLRLLEQGHGPDIEIAWPAEAADRSELYRLFSQCFGMRTVVISDAGTVYDIGGDRSAAGSIDADRYSGFARQPAGDLSAEEQQRIDAIRRRYDVPGGQVLRLFPRHVDAILLGALHRIAGAGFDRGVRIRARYRTGTAGILVADIRVAERPADEQIMLPFSAQQQCRADKIR